MNTRKKDFKNNIRTCKIIQRELEKIQKGEKSRYEEINFLVKDKYPEGIESIDLGKVFKALSLELLKIVKVKEMLNSLSRL